MGGNQLTFQRRQMDGEMDLTSCLLTKRCRPPLCLNRIRGCLSLFACAQASWYLLSAKACKQGGRAFCFWSTGCCKSWGAAAVKAFTAPSLLSIEKSQYPSVCQMALNRCCYSR